MNQRSDSLAKDRIAETPVTVHFLTDVDPGDELDYGKLPTPKTNVFSLSDNTPAGERPTSIVQANFSCQTQGVQTMKGRKIYILSGSIPKSARAKRAVIIVTFVDDEPQSKNPGPGGSENAGIGIPTFSPDPTLSGRVALKPPTPTDVAEALACGQMSRLEFLDALDRLSLDEANEAIRHVRKCFILAGRNPADCDWRDEALHDGTEIVRDRTRAAYADDLFVTDFAPSFDIGEPVA